MIHMPGWERQDSLVRGSQRYKVDGMNEHGGFKKWKARHSLCRVKKNLASGRKLIYDSRNEIGKLDLSLGNSSLEAFLRSLGLNL